MSGTATPLRIVLIEDNQDHARILKWAFERSNRQTAITFFPDGEAALHYFRPPQSAATSRRPDLIFLDLNLPKIDGRELLRILKSEHQTKDVPVIVLSSSNREEDVRQAYELGASTYISKSLLMNELSEALEGILSYWSTIATLPHRR